jgi:hypothetical protein
VIGALGGGSKTLNSDVLYIGFQIFFFPVLSSFYFSMIEIGENDFIPHLS